MKNNIDNKKYIKIPNFFSNNESLFSDIGGKESFVLYCMLISRQSICRDVYISTNEITHYLNIDLNNTRSREKILNYLTLQKNNGLIDFDFNISEIQNNTFFKIKCTDIENNSAYLDLVNFYEDDFLVHEKIGITPYCVMWVLRMMKNKSTDISKVGIQEISKLLSCKNSTVQHTIYLFEYAELFEIVRRNNQYDSNYYKKIGFINEYRYNNDTSNLISMHSKKIIEILTDGLSERIATSKKILETSYTGEDCTNKHGVYFIFDNDNNIAYIGKSMVCIAQRSLKSIEERNLYNFTKVELKPTQAQSDVDIYEKYYIQKHKPYRNSDGIYEDKSTLALPGLSTKQIIHNKTK